MVLGEHLHIRERIALLLCSGVCAGFFCRLFSGLLCGWDSSYYCVSMIYGFALYLESLLYLGCYILYSCGIVRGVAFSRSLGLGVSSVCILTLCCRCV